MNDKLRSIYEMLLSHYGDPKWWPARTPYEVIVGAILTQNTTWTNVEKSISNFGDKISPEIIVEMSTEELIEIIRPSGFFNAKASYLKAVTAWYARYDYDMLNVRKAKLVDLRTELLSTKGIGQETADSILLYAFGFPTFVVDTYTHRLCSRYPLEVGKSYEDIKSYFEDSLPESVEVYNKFHALIVVNAKEHCKKKPSCLGCPLSSGCQKCCI